MAVDIVDWSISSSNYSNRRGYHRTPIPVRFMSAGGAGTTCSASYTYYQRVFDDTFSFWCYYSGTSPNESPGTTDTTPNNSGNISGYSIVSVVDQIVCS